MLSSKKMFHSAVAMPMWYSVNKIGYARVSTDERIPPLRLLHLSEPDAQQFTRKTSRGEKLAAGIAQNFTRPKTA